MKFAAEKKFQIRKLEPPIQTTNNIVRTPVSFLQKKKLEFGSTTPEDCKKFTKRQKEAVHGLQPSFSLGLTQSSPELEDEKENEDFVPAMEEQEVPVEEKFDFPKDVYEGKISVTTVEHNDEVFDICFFFCLSVLAII